MRKEENMDVDTRSMQGVYDVGPLCLEECDYVLARLLDVSCLVVCDVEVMDV